MRAFLLFKMDGTFHSILMARMEDKLGDWRHWRHWLPVRKNLIPDAAEAGGASVRLITIEVSHNLHLTFIRL